MKPFFLGSLPHDSVAGAIQFVKTHATELPFLPQLPGLNPQEDMVGQVLRGFEIGTWDDKASVCLAAFWKEFSNAPRAKIQIAGPLTISRTMCMGFHEIIPQWTALFEGLCGQWESAKMRGEFWLQIDEPFWSVERPLPEAYLRFVSGLKKLAPKLKVGIHSCASERPSIDPELFSLCQFFSFDFSKVGMTLEEKTLWKQAPERLVAGIQSKDRPVATANVIPEVEWISATCGLADWTVDEIEALAIPHQIPLEESITPVV